MANKYKLDKVCNHGYHYYYPDHFVDLRNERFNLVEIGYAEGQSHSFFREYFPNANVYSLDIDPCSIDSSHVVIKCDQSQTSDLVKSITKIEKAQIIIDDGSHHPRHQYETFCLFFDKLLEDGGIYIIEDIECNYWRKGTTLYSYEIDGFSFIEQSKRWVEQINEEFSRVKNTLRISSITYGQNCVIVKKQTSDETNYFARSYRFSGLL